MILKTCPGCSKPKMYTEYYFRTDGTLQHECKECMTRRATINRQRRRAQKAAEAAQI